MRALLGLICALAAFAAQGLAAGRWRSQYFYDEDAETLVFADLQCPSATRCLAVGSIQSGKGRKPVSVLTSDGGKTWSIGKLQEHPVSLFFLNEGLGWMVAENSELWQTTEVGRNWKQVGKIPAPAVRVYFTTENDGWAAAGKKSVFETHDGGHRWTPVPAAAEPPGEAKYSAYTWLAFAGKSIGLITGWNIPQHAETVSQLPEWMSPESAPRRTGPHLSYSLTTADGGKSWHAASGSLIGEVARVRLGENGAGLGLMEYPRGFRYPSEVYRIDMRSAKTATVYRDAKFHITDVWLAPDGAAFLAGRVVETQAWDLAPGKVKILRSADWTTWVELEVYYRAIANRVILAGSPDGSMWAATDSGMILKLMP
jgi:photosystem II stability/assembly factor-like uncharacterized protein